jgi:hypothetical protein
MGKLVFWVFAACGAPLALALARLAVEGLRKLIPGRSGHRGATARGRCSFSGDRVGLSRLGPSRTLWRATRPGSGVCG